MTGLNVPDCLNEAGDAVRMRTLPLLDFGDVIKGLFKGRRYARIAWQAQRVLFWQEERDTIYIGHDAQMVRALVWSPAPGELVARDWIEVIP